MNCLLPIQVKDCQVTKLALIPFEKDPDEIYRGFELQYLAGGPNGEGYRLLAYRNDRYVDVYDDMTLNFIEDETFDVVENGLNVHVQVELKFVHFERDDMKAFISCQLHDINGREIIFQIREFTKKRTKPINLLAPVGVGAKKPTSMPVFFLYEFDFARIKKTIANCLIDGKERKLDRFPVPMNFQSRYFTRFSEQCELFEFATTDRKEIQFVQTNENNIYVDGNVEYHFSDQGNLQLIRLIKDRSDIRILFLPEIHLDESYRGSFQIEPRKEMGFIKGDYQISKKGDVIVMRLIPSGGWTSVPTSLLSKMILGKKSVFCNWSKKYIYEAEFDLKEKVVSERWTNNNKEAD